MSKRPPIIRPLADVPLDPEDIYTGDWVRDGLILRPVGGRTS